MTKCLKNRVLMPFIDLYVGGKLWPCGSAKRPVNTAFAGFNFSRIFCFLVIHPISSVILGVHLPSKSGKFEPTQFVLKSLLDNERPFSSVIDDETFAE